MFKGWFKKFSIIFFVLYLIMVLFPGLVIDPTDFILGWIAGAPSVDGWTHGVMLYFYLVFLLPVCYLIFLFFYYLYKLWGQE
ncbi:MAG: hypothetical protein OIF35_05880 [Cellvibrionaceae bacterium]|nr:hypothetical protein [Cellvibrionaceae bacterium]